MALSVSDSLRENKLKNAVDHVSSPHPVYRYIYKPLARDGEPKSVEPKSVETTKNKPLLKAFA